jgi:hypothetical protein
MKEVAVSDYDFVYLIAGALLVAIVALGLMQVRRRPDDPHSGLTEIEEARRRMLH